MKKKQRICFAQSREAEEDDREQTRAVPYLQKKQPKEQKKHVLYFF